MRAPVLSVTRPWSTWLASGIKPIENRTWATNYRSPLWIHAAKSWDDDAHDFAESIGGSLTDDQIMLLGWRGPHPDEYPTGILALVDLASICYARDADLACTCGPWAIDDQYHWRITNPRPLTEPIPARGRLGLWWPDPDLQAQLDPAHDLLSTKE